MHALSLPIKPVWIVAKGTRMAVKMPRRTLIKLFLFPSFVLSLFLFFPFGGLFLF